MEHKDIIYFLDDAKSMIISRLKTYLKKLKHLKVNVIFYGRFEGLVEGQLVEQIKHFQTRNSVISKSSDLTDCYEKNVK